MTGGEQRYLPFARLSILRVEKEKNFSYLAQILGPTLAWERSADAPDLARLQPSMGADGSRSPTNLQHLRATARF